MDWPGIGPGCQEREGRPRVEKDVGDSRRTAFHVLVADGVAMAALWRRDADDSDRRQQEVRRDRSAAEVLVGRRTAGPAGLRRTDWRRLSCVSRPSLGSSVSIVTRLWTG